MKKLLELAKECPDITISVKLDDLIECNRQLLIEAKKELQQLITDENTETYPSVDKVAQILGVNKSTLWRWSKNGYLRPVEIGGKRRYKMSDVKRILEGNRYEKH